MFLYVHLTVYLLNLVKMACWLATNCIQRRPGSCCSSNGDEQSLLLLKARSISVDRSAPYRRAIPHNGILYGRYGVQYSKSGDASCLLDLFRNCSDVLMITNNFSRLRNHVPSFQTFQNPGRCSGKRPKRPPRTERRFSVQPNLRFTLFFLWHSATVPQPLGSPRRISNS